jgi:hypothetical protein
MTQHIWTVRNITIGDDGGIGYYTSKANAVASIRTWLTDQRVTILTDLHEIDLRSRRSASVEFVVRNLGSHKHQVLEIERHNCNNGAWMVHTLRQGQDDPEPEKAESFAKPAEIAEEITSKSLITDAEKTEIDLHFEQKVAGAMGTLLSPYLEKDRARVSLGEIVLKVAELMNIHCPAGRAVYSTGAIGECIIDRLASEELHMRLDGTNGYTDKRQLSYRFLATIEEALSPAAYVNWAMPQVKVVPVQEASKDSGFKCVLQLRRAYRQLGRVYR